MKIETFLIKKTTKRGNSLGGFYLFINEEFKYLNSKLLNESK
ncbi:Uncharacterised protein [Mycoplasmopsis arginini]|nr:Uncharacterised protein [Chlamydia abortus]SGA27741.1 Uncharacterised protein [Mycoplasmopsis arginini]SGA30725.1 Uncharacterised protein [Mycoplasmopsis arginini]SGA32684.1 Uncharacterised protein [Chlamydia abortus]